MTIYKYTRKSWDSNTFSVSLGGVAGNIKKPQSRVTSHLLIKLSNDDAENIKNYSDQGQCYLPKQSCGGKGWPQSE